MTLPALVKYCAMWVYETLETVHALGSPHSRRRLRASSVPGSQDFNNPWDGLGWPGMRPSAWHRKVSCVGGRPSVWSWRVSSADSDQRGITINGFGFVFRHLHPPCSTLRPLRSSWLKETEHATAIFRSRARRKQLWRSPISRLRARVTSWRAGGTEPASSD